MGNSLSSKIKNCKKLWVKRLYQWQIFIYIWISEREQTAHAQFVMEILLMKNAFKGYIAVCRNNTANNSNGIEQY